MVADMDACPPFSLLDRLNNIMAAIAEILTSVYGSKLSLLLTPNEEKEPVTSFYWSSHKKKSMNVFRRPSRAVPF